MRDCERDTQRSLQTSFDRRLENTEVTAKTQKTFLHGLGLEQAAADCVDEEEFEDRQTSATVKSLKSAAEGSAGVEGSVRGDDGNDDENSRKQEQSSEAVTGAAHSGPGTANLAERIMRSKKMHSSAAAAARAREQQQVQNQQENLLLRHPLEKIMGWKEFGSFIESGSCLKNGCSTLPTFAYLLCFYCVVLFSLFVYSGFIEL